MTMTLSLISKIKKFIIPYLVPLIIALASYILFFHSLVFNFYTVFWGSDMKHKFYPIRVYLYEEIVTQHRFPFWTEKIYSGFPIYADIENAYLHPINILYTIVFSPILSYKLLHISCYLLGSIGYYLLLKKRGVGKIGYIVANLIFFFSYFFINHQIHQSLILSFYTFPLSLYLLDMFMSYGSKKYIFYSILVLVSVFYWGHPQMFLIYLLGIFVYYFSFYPTKQNIKKGLLYFVTLGWFVFSLSLPQLLPSVLLNSYSVRSFDAEDISAMQGSFNPLMITSLFYPTIFLDNTNYQGEDINSDFSFVETYVYVGLTSTILFLIGIFILKDEKIQKFALLSYFVFFFLTFSYYIPFFNLDRIPVISLFRYWTRSVILLVFAISFVVGYFLDSLYNKKLENFGLQYKTSITIFLSLALLVLINIKNAITLRIVRDLYIYVRNGYNFKEWIVLFIATTLLIITLWLFYYKKELTSQYFLVSKILIFSLVIGIALDLRYFSNDIIDIRTDNIADLQKVLVSSEYDNTRVIVERGEIENNESLYYDFWSPYGYSQFVDEAYYNSFKEHKIDKISRPVESEIHTDNYPFYRSLGINYIIVDSEIIVLRDRSNFLDIFESDIPGYYIHKDEGHILLSAEVPDLKTGTLQTYIKKYPGWKVYVEGEQVEVSDENLFISFPISEGEHIIEFRFKPIHFYNGLLYSIVGVGLGLGVYYYLLKSPIKMNRNK